MGDNICYLGICDIELLIELADGEKKNNLVSVLLLIFLHAFFFVYFLFPYDHGCSINWHNAKACGLQPTCILVSIGIHIFVDAVLDHIKNKKDKLFVHNCHL
ncbi:hypothetical protein ACJX0J_036227 [Zea mays]